MKTYLVFSRLFLIALIPSVLFAADTNWRLRMDGFGPVKSGMTQEQVQNIIGVYVGEDTDSPTENCWYLRGQKHLKGVSFKLLLTV